MSPKFKLMSPSYVKQLEVSSKAQLLVFIFHYFLQNKLFIFKKNVFSCDLTNHVLDVSYPGGTAVNYPGLGEHSVITNNSNSKMKLVTHLIQITL